MPRWLAAYVNSNDSHVAAANFVAMVLAWNQPFYPLYLLGIIGEHAWVGLPPVLSGIAFFAVPALARRWSLLGRIALPVFGMANTVLCLALLGERSGVTLFLIPCAMLAAMLFRWRERFVMLGVASLPLVVWLAVRGAMPPPPVDFTDAEYQSLFTLNAVSVGGLMVFLGWVLLARDRPAQAA